MGGSDLDLRAKDGGVTVRLRVQPRAAKGGVGGIRDGALVLRVTAPPVEGAANAAVVKLLAKLLGRAPSQLTLLHGSTGRDKTVFVADISPADVRARLCAPETPR